MRLPDPIEAQSSSLTDDTTALRGVARPRLWRRRRKNFGLIMGISWLLLVVLGALLANVLPLSHPRSLDIGSTPPFLPPNLLSDNPLGTNQLGQDQLSRVVYGARPSLLVGLSSTLIGMTIGGLIGVISGFAGRWIDTTVSALTTIVLAFPPLLLLLALVAALTPSVTTSIIGLSVLVIPTAVRVARAATMRISQEEYVFAARVLGARSSRIILRELIPSVLLSLLPLVFIFAAFMMVAEGTLSFLGMGVQAPDPSWGNMIGASQPFVRDHSALLFVPAIAMLLTILALSAIGENLNKRIGGSQR